MIGEKINITIYIIINMIDLVIILRFYQKIFGKCRLKRWILILVTGCFLAFFSIFIKLEIPYINLVNLSSWSMLFLLFYSGSIKIKGLIVVLLLAFAGTCQSVPYFLINKFRENSNFIIIISGHFLFFCMLELGSRLYKTHNGTKTIKGHMWFVLLFIPLFSFFSIPCILLIVHNTTMSLKMLYICLIPIFLFLIFIDFIAFYLFDKLSILIETTEQNIRLEEQLQYQTAYYKSVEEGQKHISYIKHDMKNHLETIDNLLSQNRIQDAKNYICQLTKSIEKVEKVIVTNNPSIDTILNIKLKEAKRNYIKFHYQINIPEGLLFSYEKATAVLGNLLDNAIESQYQISENRRKVELIMIYNKQALMITIKNPIYENRIHLEDLKTTKQEKEQHGFGLQNVQKVVDEMGGIMKLSIEKNIFQADILLYF